MKFELLLRKAWPYLGKHNLFFIDNNKMELTVLDCMGNRFTDVDPYSLSGISNDIKSWLINKGFNIQIKQLFNNDWICNVYNEGSIIAGAKANSQEFAILISAEKIIKRSK